MANEVTVTVSGPVGCGKSAIAGEIEIAMKAIGVPVRYADSATAQTEKNMTHADWGADLDLYKPSVVLVERIERGLVHRDMGPGFTHVDRPDCGCNPTRE